MRLEREHLEFIQHQAIPWTRLRSGRPWVGHVGKVLSEASDGSGTYLVSFASGDHGDMVVPDDCVVQIIVLSGAMRVKDVLATELHYLRCAAPDTLVWVCEEDAVVLSFVDHVTWPNVSSAGPIDIEAIPWRIEKDEWFAAGAARKDVWIEQSTGEELFLMGTMPLRWNSRAQVHPVAEEVFVLSGELIGERGVLTAGAYFWRPAGLWHGPFGQRQGALLLIRSPGGPLTKLYAEDSKAVERFPAYAPVVPAALAETASRSADHAMPSAWGGVQEDVRETRSS